MMESSEITFLLLVLMACTFLWCTLCSIIVVFLYALAPREHFTKGPLPSLLQASPDVLLSVILPVYNDGDGLYDRILKLWIAYLERKSDRDPTFSFEVLLVNDGNNDDSAEKALDFFEMFGEGRGVAVHQLGRHLGKGFAWQLGMAKSRGKYIILADPKDDFIFRVVIDDFLAAMRDRGAVEGEGWTVPSLVIGSRVSTKEGELPAATTTTGYFRIPVVIHFFNFMVWLVGVQGYGFREAEYGIKLLSRSAAQEMIKNVHFTTRAFDLELLYVAQKKGIPVRKVEMVWKECGFGIKYNTLGYRIRMGLDLFTMWIQYRTGCWRIH